MLPSAPLKDGRRSGIIKNRILVVDDNSSLRNLLVRCLNQSGYEAIEAATSLEALQQARSTCPDLILMDLAMPEGNGDEAIAWLKADPLTRDKPVIVLTAFRYGSLVERAIAAGAAEILYKPVNLNWLDLTLQRHLSIQCQTQRLLQS